MTGWTSGSDGIPAGWTVPEPEWLVMWVKVPEENKPEAIAIAGSFGDGFTMERLDNGLYFENDENFKAYESDTFMFRDSSDHSKVLCKKNGDEWVQAVFTFGDLWVDGSYKGTPCKEIEELDISEDASYAWKEINQ
ncbi:MAG: hypothetical protein K6G80_09075 [Treponema sp.]|nr:hypothetical protein [Treponema sp.]